MGVQAGQINGYAHSNPPKEVNTIAERADLEAADIEAIKRLKAKYWHCVDNKLWDEVGDCFTQDSLVDYSGNKSQGRQAIVEYMKDTLGRGPVSHKGHSPKIEIASDTSAMGTWEASVSMTDVETEMGMKLRVFYEDEYVKEKGEWRIKSTTMRVISMERSKT